MPDLATIQFSFFSFISLSSASVCALSMKKFTAGLKLRFSSDLVPLLFVLFGKITLNWFFLILSSLSFSSLKFSHYSFDFFCLRWLINFICFLRFHPFFFSCLVQVSFIAICFSILSFKIKLAGDWAFSPSLRFHELWF